jgi:hypothetical protein
VLSFSWSAEAKIGSTLDSGLEELENDIYIYIMQEVTSYSLAARNELEAVVSDGFVFLINLVNGQTLLQ